MTTQVTKQGIVWRHEMHPLESTTFGDREPQWMPGLPTYTLRVGRDDLSVTCYNGETLPRLGSITSVDVWVEESDESTTA